MLVKIIMVEAIIEMALFMAWFGLYIKEEIDEQKEKKLKKAGK